MGLSILKVLGSLAASKGPHGESPTSARFVELSADEIARVRKLKATAAVIMHYGGDDWSSAQIAGIRHEFENLGIKIVASTEAGFDMAKQISDISAATALKPNVLISIPIDSAATANAFQKAAKEGVKLVFMENVPTGMQAGKDYVACVSADSLGSGYVAAHIMADAVNCVGKIGIISHAADFFVTKQRYEGFKSTFKDKYARVQIVSEQGVLGPDFAAQAEAAAKEMLARYPDLKGIWAVWDVPAEGVMAAAESAGRADLVITTVDLGRGVALSLAQSTMIKGVAAQRPFDQGVVEAKLAAYGLLGKPAPAYVTLPALPVMHDNLLEAWKEVYHCDPPAEITSSYLSSYHA